MIVLSTFVTAPFSTQGETHFLLLFPGNKHSTTPHFKTTVWDLAAGMVLIVNLALNSTEVIAGGKSLH